MNTQAPTTNPDTPERIPVRCNNLTERNGRYEVCNKLVAYVKPNAEPESVEVVCAKCGKKYKLPMMRAA